MVRFRVKNYKIMLSWASKKIQNPVLKFMCLWIVMNHWYKTFYEKSKNGLSDKECIGKIKEDYQIFHKLFNNQNLEPLLERDLINASKIAKTLKFNNIPTLLFDGFHIDQEKKNYETLIDLVYEVRNKLFHGDISVNNLRIRRLVKSLNDFIEHFIASIILNPHITK